MYLHLGYDVSVKKNSIVAIFDLEKTSTSKLTREFFHMATLSDKVINVSEKDLPRSYILTVDEKGKEKIYVSPISSQTLSKRANIFDLEGR